MFFICFEIYKKKTTTILQINKYGTPNINSAKIPILKIQILKMQNPKYKWKKMLILCKLGQS